ncbi:phosphohistidine phosphatase SixA [Haemophilus pittmaniae HK 85]|uniref:Phosphohistidine phosphatase SixA n=1 Tax=Haemophilus pittmaniae HK 85 TaxID=1035188 RepID=F9Q5L9_9PAST|nr:phosphohistidine phosphatase SixA [Haemophilus pittmaniae HK 85]
MKVFIMRHGESEVMAQSDKERRLTDYGKHQSTLQGEWLQQYLKMTGIVLDKVLVSPYTRAQQTFTAVSAAFSGDLDNKMETWEGITPYGNETTVANYLAVLAEQGTQAVLLISHLPLVGDIVAELYGKRNPISFIHLPLLKWIGMVRKDV